MTKKDTLFGKWDKFWGKYKDLRALNNAYEHLDLIFKEIEAATGRILLSSDMIAIQEELINRIEQLSANQTVTVTNQS